MYIADNQGFGGSRHDVGWSRGTSEWAVSLPDAQSIGAVDVKFRALSGFTALSGFSMLPTQTKLFTSAHADRSDADSYVIVAVAGEFIERRFYLNGLRARHLKLRMTGSARWFAIEHVAVFEQLIDRRSVADRRDVYEYITAVPLPKKIADTIQRSMPYKALQTLNVGRDCLTAFLPHCLGKLLGIVKTNKCGGGGGAYSRTNRRPWGVSYLQKP